MADADRSLAVPTSSLGTFVDTCQWIVDAHEADDREQTTSAMCELYRLLAQQGWAPPDKVSFLLHLQSAAADAALERLVEPFPSPSA